MLEKKHILFVDDDPHILQALRRRLASQSSDWQMMFVEGGPEALEAMARAPFDVIVTDMRMPHIDGEALLQKVKRFYPHVACIILSGQSDRETILRAVGPTHQYLSKPCDTEQLKRAIARTCALRQLLADQRLREIVAGMSYLPSLPAIYVELLAELQVPEPSLKRVGEILSHDISMTAKVLQLVNSEFFGVSQRIVTAKDAVAYLGLETLRSLVITLDIFSGLSTRGLVGSLFKEMWIHSLHVGVCARQIANSERLGKETAEASFTAGLLHDIGRLVIAFNLPEQYRETILLAETGRMRCWEAERMILGTSHMEIGAYLLGLWGLPDAIVEAAAFHHQPSRCVMVDFQPLTAVHVADCLQRPPGEISQVPFDESYLNALGMSDRVPNWQILCEATIEERLGDELREPGGGDSPSIRS